MSFLQQTFRLWLDRAGTRIPFLCLLLLLAGCGGPADADFTRDPDFPLPADAHRVDTEGQTGGTLRYALSGEPATFNPLAARDVRSQLIAHLTSGTLLEFDPILQQVVPGVCREWEVSDDGRVVTLRLRRGLRFSDGLPATAHDVVFTFERIYEEGSTNVLRGALLIEGRPLEVSSLDEETVQVAFPRPHAAAEHLLSRVPVLPRHRLEDRPGRIEEAWGLATPPEELSGLGPFRLVSHAPGLSSTLHYNPHYWKVDRNGKRLPYLSELVLDYVDSRDSQLLRFRAGQLDLIDRRLRAEDFFLLEREASDRFHLENAGPSSELSFLWFNLNSGSHPETGRPFVAPQRLSWFQQRGFRQAVSRAIRRDSIRQNVYLGMARPAWSLIPVSIPFWHASEVPRYEYDPEAAREQLRELGFGFRSRTGAEVLVDPEGGTVSFELLIPSDELLNRMAAVVQQDLAEIGIRVGIRQEEFRTAVSRITGSRDYEAAMMKLEFGSEPSDHGHVLFSDGPMHFWHLGRKEPATDWESRIDELMRRQIFSRDPEERRRLYLEVQEILARELPILPLVNADVLVAGRSGLRNLRPAPLFPYALWNVWEIWWE